MRTQPNGWVKVINGTRVEDRAAVEPLSANNYEEVTTQLLGVTTVAVGSAVTSSRTEWPKAEKQFSVVEAVRSIRPHLVVVHPATLINVHLTFPSFSFA